jgi:hypothetical protein
LARLKEVQISLQADLIRRLGYAQIDNNLNEFKQLIKISDNARAKALGVLCDLRAESSPGLTSGRLPIPTTEAQDQYPKNEPTIAKEVPLVLHLDDPFKSKASVGLRKHSRSHSDVTSATTHSVPQALEQAPSFVDPFVRLKELDLVSGTGRRRTNSNGDSKPLPPIPRSGDNLLDTRQAFANNAYTPLKPLLQRFASQGTYQTIPSSTNSESKITPNTRLIEPSSFNDYHGFCPGAIAFQSNQKDSLKLRKAMGPVQTTIRYWGCSNRKCAFEGEAIPASNNQPLTSSNLIYRGFTTDTSIHTAFGVQFRWAFLAKSHVAQSRVRDRIFSYKCLFCTLHGIETPVVQRISNLMEHIASTHRADNFSQAFLKSINCIVNRRANSDEEFDVNLIPLETKIPMPLANGDTDSTNSISTLGMIGGSTRNASTDDHRESVYAFFGPDDFG